MKALSIRQPWAHFILFHGKDVENRTWRTKIRGRILIHASKGMTRNEYADACDVAEHDIGLDFDALPLPASLDRGGIVGSVEIVDCVTHSRSAWWAGPYAFVLRDPIPLPFAPCRGALGFFDVSQETLERRRPQQLGLQLEHT